MIIQKITVLFLFYFIHVEGGYTVTTPRRWTVDQPGLICVTLTESSDGQDYINVVFKSINPRKEDKPEENVSAQKTFAITAGDRSNCYEHILPSTASGNVAISIEGNLLGKNASHSHRITVVRNSERTFIQTDKYLYKPDQTVQFRILSLKGPLLQVSTENFAEIWVENPSSSRIHQWQNVTNPDGLMHRSFQLSEEPDQGEYKVSVQVSSGATFSTTFKVEDYVLPRYEITATPPAYILGTSKEAVFKVCARYTFGQPVKGILTFIIDNGGWSGYKFVVNKIANISGCSDVPISMKDLQINSDSYYSYAVNVKASVTEDGTGVQLEADPISVPISRTVITFKDVGQQQYRKPGIPFVDEVLAELPDGSPAVNEPMTVCVRDTCRNLTTNANGILKYAIAPNEKDSILVKSVNYKRISTGDSWRTIMRESNIYRSHKTYHSPSNSSLIIALDQEALKCQEGRTLEFDLLVRYAASGQGNTLVHVQVISRGLIQFFTSSIQDLSKSNDIHIPDDIYINPPNETTSDNVRGAFTIPGIRLPITVSPKAQLIVWYARADKEVVVDHRSLDVGECLSNPVNLQWSVDLAEPGDQANLTIDSEPMSLCSLGVVDKSVELLSSSQNSLTANKLLQLADESMVRVYENTQVDDNIYCSDEANHKTPNKPSIMGDVPPPPMRRHYGRSFSKDADALTLFSEAGIFVFSDLTLETRLCEESIDDFLYDGHFEAGIQFAMPGIAAGALPPSPEVYSYKQTESSLPQEDNENSRTSARVYFPETWLWEIYKNVENGSLQIPLVLPDTVTEWVGRAVCLHPTLGVGLSNPAAITTFKQFFVDLTLPATTKRGEIFPLKLSLFNYLKEQLPVKITVMASPEYDILSESKEELGTGLRAACVEPEGKTVFSIRIKPKVVGQVNITVDAIIDINSVQCGGALIEERRDIVVKPVKVDYEGFPKEKTWNNYICVEENAENPSDVWNMAAPTGIVEDSARGWLSAVSDLMGPTLENLGHLVRMPYGCGEQNMLNFAPNIFVLQYLESVNETTEELGAKSVQFMEKGYQRELNYRHTDGSFSAFGTSDDSGSTWLTAFVLKSFHKAQQFINIDPADLAMSVDWLRSKQLENGCFQSVGRVIHKDMKGGIQDSGSPSLLTAYVLLSLLEAGEDPTSPVVREAQFCLNADNTKDPYALAVRLYTFALANSPEATPTAEILLSLATQASGSMSWDVQDDPKKSKSTAVEIASYAVLGLLTLDSTEYSGAVHQIIKWINQQRNAQGGFVSTQDTILALQAMALYEAVLPSTEPDATAIFTADNHEEVFHINTGNKLLLQKAKLPSIPANVTVDIFGRGCVLVQGVLRYNVLDGDATNAFSLSVETKTPYDRSCKSKEIEVCTSYLLPDLASNMAIIEVNLVSGYIPDKKDLKRVVGYGTGLFKRYEVDGSAVMFYLDEIPAEEICAKFKIIREVDVENVKPGTVKVYDYYKPEYAVSQNYVLPDNKECSMTKPELPFEKEILVIMDDIPGGMQ